MSSEFPPSAPPVAPPPVAQPANVGRGALLALATIPVGIAAWVLLWGMGFIASIVAALVAFLAVRLYVLGAGRLTRTGALVVLAITVVTLVLAFVGGIAWDAATAVGEETGTSAWGALTDPTFWSWFSSILPEVLPEYGTDIAWAAGFGALGSFTTLRGAFTQPEELAPAPAPVGEPTAPDAPGSH
ncbi:hypothetical protein [Cellulomonas cellasea]|uniref:Uncharacterized protein n=2 Tax=Cellulomonas cellasea TaxID=43670 RepID=A0A0A0B8L7_9CELL|nr:hypothetical protein [Cellulomonas cellasea]KGM03230.1 hypothetical protein Q760_08575 [Cellulomonas cellasea DSM 20118]GEA89799.1 hypothetical protein CCE01nite_37480 [Cellulomonas cellasea]